MSQWWISTHVKLISTQCVSSLCSSSAWVSSCCCYRRTGTSASSSSAQGCASVTSQQRAAERRAPLQGSTGEEEAGPPCQHSHIDSMKYDHANTLTHAVPGRETHLGVDVRTFDLPGDAPPLSRSSLSEKEFKTSL